MAKKRGRRKYSKSTSREVKNEMHRYKRGKAKSGKGGKGGRSRAGSRRSLSPCRRLVRRAKRRLKKNPRPSIVAVWR